MREKKRTVIILTLALLCCCSSGRMGNGPEGPLLDKNTKVLVRVSEGENVWCLARDKGLLDGEIEFFKIEMGKIISIFLLNNDGILDLKRMHWDDRATFVVATCEGGAVGLRVVIFRYSPEEGRVRVVLNRFTREGMELDEATSGIPDLVFRETNGGKECPYYLFRYRYDGTIFMISDDLYEVGCKGEKRKIVIDNVPYDVRPKGLPAGWKQYEK